MSQNNDGFFGFLVGSGLTTAVAVAHNSAKNRTHQAELQQAYSQGHRNGTFQQEQADAQVIRAKDAENARLRALLSASDAEKVRLNSVVEQQANAVHQRAP